MLRESRLREISFRLVPSSSGSFSRLKASFKIRCPLFIFGKKCSGYAEVNGLRIAEESGPRTMRVEQRTFRPRCTTCHMRMNITLPERAHLLSEARKFLNPKLRRREGIASQA
jgi:hypothetical protein